MTAVVSRSPQSPADVVARVPEATAGEVQAAAVRARQAQRVWAAASPAVRSSALHAVADAVAAAADELGALMVREVGKPVTEASGEVARSVAILRYYAQQVYDPIGAVYPPSPGNGLALTRRRPRGVAGLITPWNFPLAIPLWKAAPALAFGNAVLLKPAPQATACAIRLHELLAPHLPDGLLHTLPGGAPTGHALVELADLVSFTGSAAVGKQVATTAATRGIPVQCEMGGQNPAIVLPDADPAVAAGQIAGAAFGFAGQKCTATKRIIVVGDSGEFRDALVSCAEALPSGDPAEPRTVIGPVIDKPARARVLTAAREATRDQGRILTGGTTPSTASGWFVEPTLIDRLPADHQLLHEEIFGPICAIVSVPTMDEAVRAANDAPYGLTAAVYTRDLDAALLISDRLAAGQIKINAPTSGVDFHLPFGGERRSSYGEREQGKAALAFYTSLHTISVLHATTE